MCEGLAGNVSEPPNDVGGHTNRYLSARTWEVDASLGEVHVWDLAPVSLELGLTGGASVLRQVFTTRGIAPSQTGLAPHLGVIAGGALDLSPRVFVAVHLRAETTFVRRAEGADPTARMTAIFTAGAEVSVGWRY